MASQTSCNGEKASLNRMGVRCFIMTAVAVVSCFSPALGNKCVQGQNCKLPDCFCPTFEHPSMSYWDIPQIVYFGFDDAVTPQVEQYYDELFTKERKNPNGCPITMSLFVCDHYTQYDKVHQYYERGHEIAVHSVTHTNIDTKDKLQREAAEEKGNIINEGQVPSYDVIGWRSPNLKTAGDAQPDVLGSLNYTYDISLTYTQSPGTPWPFTLDFGYPYPCKIPPCPEPNKSHPGFWEVMVVATKNPKTGLPCGYVDACHPETEEDALEYLWYNFQQTYTVKRAPFGLNMHAAWFAYPHTLRATARFIDLLLQLNNVYIVNVKQMIAWMKSPVPLWQAATFEPWGCGQMKSPPSPSSPSLSTLIKPPPKQVVPLLNVTSVKNNAEDSPTASMVRSTRAPTIGFGSLWNLFRPQENSKVSQPTEQQTTRRQPESASTTHLTRETTPEIKYPERIGFGNTLFGAVTPNQVDKCIQGVTCKLPACFCRTSTPPLYLSPSNIPQIVYMAIDSRIDGNTFSSLMQIFSGFRVNPNGCPISGTIFTPSSGNYPPYVDVIQGKGVRIGIKSGAFTGFSSASSAGYKVLSEIGKARETNITYSFGWRGFANLSPSDDVFRVLHNNHIKFDSSILSDSQDMAWPYTLDFGVKDRCAVMASKCPTDRYPGMWEVPMAPLIYANHSQPCYFLDTCPGLPPTEDAIYKILLTNFYAHYNGNKSPFGINLHAEWLMGSHKTAFQKGILKFFDDVLGRGDVIITSIEQMLSWIASAKEAKNFPC